MSVGEAEYSPGEVARTLARLEAGLTELGAKIDSLSFVRADVWRAEHAALVARIEAIREEGERDRAEIRKDHSATQENLRWLVRVLVGAFLAAVVTYVVSGYGGPA